MGRVEKEAVVEMAELEEKGILDILGNGVGSRL